MSQLTRKCQWCSELFTTEYDTKQYCSRYHKESAAQFRRNNRKKSVKTIYVKKCIGCSTEYSTTNRLKDYCSQDCRAWIKEMMKRERDKEYQNARTPSFRRRVYFASSGTCGICNELIDLRLKWPNPMSYSIDHIVPRSLGGTHGINNLQAAHLQCNAVRGNRPLTNPASQNHLVSPCDAPTAPLVALTPTGSRV